MKKSILLSHAYFLRFDPKQWATKQPYAPLGTLYAAGLLRANGYPVSFYDSMFAEDADAVMDAIKIATPEIFVICDDGFNYLTKMCLTNMREAAFRMIHIARQSGCTVIVSSSDSTDHFESYLDKGADFVVLGEVEQTLLDLVEAINNDEASDGYEGIPGLAYKKNETICKTTRRNVIKDLDSLPQPAWDLIDIQPYQQMWMQSSGYFSMNIATTRGCPYKCNWCAKPIYGNRYNSRSPQNVVEEIRLLKEKFQISHIWFCDDIFGLKPGWVNAFADLMEKEQLKIGFKIQARADLLVQENYIQSLDRAGCTNVWMGAESGSQKILDAMDKGITVKQIETATLLLKKYGIAHSFFLQFGYPGETKQDIQRTIHMVNKLLPYSIGISVSYPLPGTIFYEKVKAELTIKANWTDSSELELMFSNNYQPDFYRQLHKYVHKSHRLYTAIDNLFLMIRQPFTKRMGSFKKAVSIIYYLPATLIAKQKLEKLSKI